MNTMGEGCSGYTFRVGRREGGIQGGGKKKGGGKGLENTKRRV